MHNYKGDSFRKKSWADVQNPKISGTRANTCGFPVARFAAPSFSKHSPSDLCMQADGGALGYNGL